MHAKITMFVAGARRSKLLDDLTYKAQVEQLCAIAKLCVGLRCKRLRSIFKLWRM